MKLKLMWHEPSNLLAVVDFEWISLPLMTILDDEYKWFNDALKKMKWEIDFEQKKENV